MEAQSKVDSVSQFANENINTVEELVKLISEITTNYPSVVVNRTLNSDFFSLITKGNMYKANGYLESLQVLRKDYQQITVDYIDAKSLVNEADTGVDIIFT